MGLLSKLFKKNKKKEITIEKNYVNKDCQELVELNDYIQELLNNDSYIAKSDYRESLSKYDAIINNFKVLKSNEILELFCEKNNIKSSLVDSIIDKYDNVESLVDQHNDAYIQNEMIKEKEYLDNILKEVDPVILLDDDQRKVVLTDEDYSLVIAGAGAGKTTTVAAKVKYLVEKKNIDPSQILVLSFTNKAVQELKDKLNKDLRINCPVTTFHSTGYTILRKEAADKLNIVDSSKLYFVMQEYFRESVLKNERMVNDLILFFASYFDAPYEGEDLSRFFNQIAKSNYATMRSELNDFRKEVIDKRTRKLTTIQNEYVRSTQEVEIANFLYLNNIDYDYEPIYKYDIPNTTKPYTPDFIIRQGNKVAYIEHFGITQDGKNYLYNEEQLEKYKKAVKDKIQLHKEHGTNLIITFSKYSDKLTLSQHLEKELIRNGFILNRRSNEEVMEKLIVSEENKYIKRLIDLICRFISNFKTNGYKEEDFERMYFSTQNVRSRLFLNICKECYLEYTKYLKNHNAVDFEDMINESARILREVKETKQILDYKYVIVDEYQDISRQRFDLVKALNEVTNAKIIAVGDDWQSIYAFSGSDIELFTRFEEKMGYAKMLKIVKTYRNSQEVIDIAGNFIQRNKSQITKRLLSPKSIKDPVIIYTYDGSYKKKNDNNKSGANYELACAVEKAIDQIIEYNKQEGKKNSSILLLGRFGFDGRNLERSGLFEFISRGNQVKSVKYPHIRLTYMTAHASKGLGYDNVIIINGKNDTYGFPSKIEDDPVLSFVLKVDRSMEYAEERRLFYVAMTRTKNRVYFVAPEQNPSEFLLEIKKDYKNIILKGNWNEEQKERIKKTCPICGYPLQFRYKNAYGLKLHMCTNEPELCSFMTNDTKAGKLSIMKCDKCRDGYLIAKPTKDGRYFLGCTNYKRDGKGCNNNVWADDYQNIVVDVPEKKSKAKEKSKSTLNTFKSTIIEKADVDSIMYKSFDLNEVLYVILNALNHISENKYYGMITFKDVLRGSESKKIISAQLNTIPEYGKLKGLSRDELGIILDWMIKQNYIYQTKGQYPVLHPTYEGTHYSELINVKLVMSLLKQLKNK